MEFVAARTFCLLLADCADAAARCRRHEHCHGMGVRPVRRDGVACRRTRSKSNRTSRVGEILAPRSGVRASPTRPSSVGYNRRRQPCESLRNWLEQSSGRRASGARVRRCVARSCAVQHRGCRSAAPHGGRRRLARQAGPADARDRYPDHLTRTTRRRQSGPRITDPSGSL